MPARDPGAAVLEAMATYLTTALSTLSPEPVVRRGWPETDVQVDLETAPLVAITQTGMREEARVPTPRDDPDEDGNITITVGVLYLSIQLDAWTGYREPLDLLTAAIDDALHNDEWRPHLYLTATDYHALPFYVMRVADQPDIDGDTAPSGEWRHTWTLTAVIERIRPGTAPAVVSVISSAEDIDITITD